MQVVVTQRYRRLVARTCPVSARPRRLDRDRGTVPASFNSWCLGYTRPWLPRRRRLSPPSPVPSPPLADSPEPRESSSSVVASRWSAGFRASASGSRWSPGGAVPRLGPARGSRKPRRSPGSSGETEVVIHADPTVAGEMRAVAMPLALGLSVVLELRSILLDARPRWTTPSFSSARCGRWRGCSPRCTRSRKRSSSSSTSWPRCSSPGGPASIGPRATSTRPRSSAR